MSPRIRLLALLLAATGALLTSRRPWRREATPAERLDTSDSWH
jgi:hypothetical protein